MLAYRLDMPDFPGEAIRAARESLNLTVRELAKAAGVSYALIASIERGDVNLRNSRMETLRGIMAALGWDADKFKTETGITLPSTDAESVKLPSGFRPMRLVGRASAGSPQDYDVAFPSRVWRARAVVFEIDGDSLDDGSQSAIQHGDLVFVDTTMTNVIEGRLYLLEIIGDGYAVKQARRDRGVWRFFPKNPHHAPLDADEVRVLGEVYEVMGRKPAR